MAGSQSTAGKPPGKTETIDRRTVGKLIAAQKAAAKALASTNSNDEARYRELEGRYHAANRAVWAARPTDPAEMATLVRWMLKEGDFPHAGYRDGALDIDLLRYIAEQLEAMARVRPPAGAVLLSAEAAAKIRHALTAGYAALASADTASTSDLDAMADLLRALGALEQAGRESLIA